MSHVELVLTESDLMSKQCPLPNKNKPKSEQVDSVLEQAVNGTLTGIVTYIKIADGQYQTLSRYEDDIWVYPASQGTKATVKNELNLNFSTIADEQMKRMAKWIIWNKKQDGLKIASLKSRLSHLRNYFKWVSVTDTVAINGLTAFTANAYVKYVNALTSKPKGKIKPLASGTKAHKFFSLEELYQYCQAFDFVKEHPWSDSSASEQAGNVGEAASRKKAKTPIIPNEVLMPLCRFTKDYLDRADELLALKNKLDAFVPTHKDASAQAKTGQKRQYLQSLDTEFNKLDDFNEALLLLRDSCIFWLLLTTGMRIHEILAIKRGGYRSATRDEITYHYVEAVSEKTHTGLAEWIAPKIATQAIDILGRYSEPLQAKLEADLEIAKNNQDHEEVHRLETISNHIGLCVNEQAENAINILSGKAITDKRLPNLCKKISSDWNLSAHQFRRTFANYAVHSELGDLRALKDHFKHWSITMTALYGSNDDLDAELFEELLREKYLVEEQIKQDWFELDTPITGGAMAQGIKRLREDDELIQTFGSRQEMAKSYSSSIPIRSSGIGWCTNDEECKCGSPDSCESGIIDKSHLPYWEGMLVQQMELLDLDDIGEAGRASAAKGMERCEKVLRSLGIDVEAMKQKINNRNKDRIEVINE